MNINFNVLNEANVRIQILRSFRLPLFYMIALLTNSSLAIAANMTYQDLYPYSAEVCAASQKKPIDGVPERNWGHLVLVLNGVCRDQSAPYPQLRVCEPGKSVVVSVNSYLKNVMWIAAENRDFAFKGDLQPSERLGKDQYERTLNRAISEGVFNGVKIYEDGWDRVSDRLQYLGRNAVGTDFALTFGRNVYCSNVSMPPMALTEIVRYLNSINEIYASGTDKAFRWHPIYSNCSHLVNNAFASAGVWREIKTNVGLPGQLLNLAVPANVALKLMDLTQSERFIDPVWVFRQPHLRMSLERFGWLPYRHGAVFSYQPVYEANDLYKRDLDIFVFDLPFGGKRSRFFRYSKDSQFHDMKFDLIRYRDLYRKALSKVTFFSSNKQTSEVLRLTKNDRLAFLSFLETYRIYLEVQLRDAEEKLSNFL